MCWYSWLGQTGGLNGTYRFQPEAVQVESSLLLVERDQPAASTLVPLILPHWLNFILEHGCKRSTRMQKQNYLCGFSHLGPTKLCGFSSICYHGNPCCKASSILIFFCVRSFSSGVIVNLSKIYLQMGYAGFVIKVQIHISDFKMSETNKIWLLRRLGSSPFA